MQQSLTTVYPNTENIIGKNNNFLIDIIPFWIYNGFILIP